MAPGEESLEVLPASIRRRAHLGSSKLDLGPFVRSVDGDERLEGAVAEGGRPAEVEDFKIRVVPTEGYEDEVTQAWDGGGAEANKGGGKSEESRRVEVGASRDVDDGERGVGRAKSPEVDPLNCCEGGEVDGREGGGRGEEVGEG